MITFKLFSFHIGNFNASSLLNGEWWIRWLLSTHVQLFKKNDFIEYSVRPNIHFKRIFGRIIVFPEYSVEPNITGLKFFYFLFFKENQNVKNLLLPNIRFFKKKNDFTNYTEYSFFSEYSFLNDYSGFFFFLNNRFYRIFGRIFIFDRLFKKKFFQRT